MSKNKPHNGADVTSQPLHFVLTTGEEPPVGDVRVFETLESEVAGVDFLFRIIGASHFISAPEVGFHEVASCRPVSASAAVERVLELDSSGSERLSHRSEGIECDVTVDLGSLDAFPRNETFDLSYRFAPDAYTTIDIFETGYETYHTYPEHDLTVYTETDFSRLDK